MFLRMTQLGFCTVLLVGLSVSVGCRSQGHQASPGAENTTGVPVANGACPITGTPIDSAAVPPELTRMYQGQRIGFCCKGCPEKWDRMDDQARARKLAQVMKH
jgi:hypothetical protein